MPGEVSPLFARRLPERARWRILLLILCWPILQSLFAVAIGEVFRLPENTHQLMLFLFLELLLWVPVFVVGFRISGITARQLRLETSHPLRTIGLGALWFVAIRISTVLMVLAVARWIDPAARWITEEKLAFLVDAKNIPHHPQFSILVFGLVAVIGGFTEELWRAGMLTGINSLFPGLRAFPSICLVSVLFGLAHLYQGWLGVGNALVLGILLGSVLVYRNSYWEAAIAHTLIDALALGVAIILALNVHRFDHQVVYGAAHGDLPLLKHWLRVGGNINATFDVDKDWKNITALEAAAGRPDPEIVRFLLEGGADPNLADSHKRTPLIAAADQNQVSNVVLLIAHGANINDEDNRGFTALRSAAEYNHVEIARVLLNAGADVNMRDKEGLSPLAAAMKYRYDDLKNLLQQNGAK